MILKPAVWILVLSLPVDLAMLNVSSKLFLCSGCCKTKKTQTNKQTWLGPYRTVINDLGLGMEWGQLILECICSKYSISCQNHLFFFFFKCRFILLWHVLSAGNSCDDCKHSVEETISFQSAADCITGLVL